MSYKSILTFVDGESSSDARLDAVFDIARLCDASITVIAVGYSLQFPYPDLGESATIVLADILRNAEANSETLASDTEAKISQAGLNGNVKSLICNPKELGDEIGRHARFADLVVLSPAYGDGHSIFAGDAIEGSLFVGDAPVLIRAESQSILSMETAVIAWNGSREALRAVRHAMPLLERTSSVEIVMVDQPHEENASAEALAELLKRHGITAVLSNDSMNFRSVTGSLLQHIADTGAGLLVMGAYSHSWFREYMLGGVTREIISNPPVPVVVAH